MTQSGAPLPSGRGSVGAASKPAAADHVPFLAKKNFTIFCLLLVLSSLGWLRTFGEPLVPEPFFFLQLADPQFGMYTADKDFRQETSNFEFAIANANRLFPAFVIVCGDLINKAGDPAQTAEYLRVASKLDRSIRLYNVPGNHDVGNEPTVESLAMYRRNFGPDYYTFRVANMAGFVLNSSIIAAPRNVPQELAKQESWLRQELERAKNDGMRRLVVFQHHPWFLSAPDEKDQYFNIPLERRRTYLELFARYGVSHVFAGHYHRNAFGKDGALEMVTTGPVGKPLGKDPSGFRVVIVRDTGIEHQYYGLGEIPNKVELAERATTGHEEVREHVNMQEIWPPGMALRRYLRAGVRARSVSDGSYQTKSAIQTYVWQTLLLWRDPSLTLRALKAGGFGDRN
ncbi:MAG TPA: metallophosphoesterase [Acidobacteriota bacterium]|nr:metallophosphoesterase [Acidobacteriota bacterium]